MRKAMQLKSKIKNLALKNKTPAQAVLQNFMLEPLLERITVSQYKDIFILLLLHISESACVVNKKLDSSTVDE